MGESSDNVRMYTLRAGERLERQGLCSETQFTPYKSIVSLQASV